MVENTFLVGKSKGVENISYKNKKVKAQSKP